MAQISFVCDYKDEKISQEKSPQIADFRKVTYDQVFSINDVFNQEQPPNLFDTSAIMNVQFFQLSEPNWDSIPCLTPSWQLNRKM